MLVPNQIINIVLNSQNRQYYKDKGYNFNESDKKLRVHIEDLPSHSSVRIKVKCDDCGIVYKMSWAGYYKSYKKHLNDLQNICPECKKKRRQESLYTKALKVCEKKSYTLLSKQEDIINNITYVDYLCPIHGKHSMRIASLISGKSCPDCVILNNSEKFRLSSNEVESRIKECGGVLLNKEDYKNQTEKNLIVKCPECGIPCTTSLRSFTQHGGQLCDNCSNNVSLGEKRIKYYLKDNKI